MTSDQFAKVKVGSVLRSKKTKRVRLVVFVSLSGKQLALAKIGRSWTDPNPTAWYDKFVVMRDFAVTRHVSSLELEAFDRRLDQWVGFSSGLTAKVRREAAAARANLVRWMRV
jgi:hypothetical protein